MPKLQDFYSFLKLSSLLIEFRLFDFNKKVDCKISENALTNQLRLSREQRNSDILQVLWKLGRSLAKKKLRIKLKRNLL